MSQTQEAVTPPRAVVVTSCQTSKGAEDSSADAGGGDPAAAGRGDELPDLILGRCGGFHLGAYTGDGDGFFAAALQLPFTRLQAPSTPIDQLHT